MSSIAATADALATAGVEIEHLFIAKELYSKRTTIKAGTKLRQHVHPYDHASALVSGTARVTYELPGHEPLVAVLTGPQMLHIRKGLWHEVEALTDIVWHCIHINDDTDPATVDQSILKG